MADIASAVIVEEAFKSASKLEDQVVVLARSCFWKEALYRLEDEHKRHEKTKFVIYPDSTGEGFRVQTVPINASSFNFRKGLKEEWRGLEATELASKSGIADIIFCHHAGFIGGAKSVESCLKMAEISLRE